MHDAQFAVQRAPINELGMPANPIRSDSIAVGVRIQKFPEFIKFIEWFATPSQFRAPRTQKEFSTSIGVCQDTLTDWKRDPNFWPLVQQAISAWAKDRIPDVIGGLYTNASQKGSPKAVEMFIRLAGIPPQTPGKQ